MTIASSSGRASPIAVISKVPGNWKPRGSGFSVAVIACRWWLGRCYPTVGIVGEGRLRITPPRPSPRSGEGAERGSIGAPPEDGAVGEALEEAAFGEVLECDERGFVDRLVVERDDEGADVLALRERREQRLRDVHRRLQARVSAARDRDLRVLRDAELRGRDRALPQLGLGDERVGRVKLVGFEE